MIQVAGIDDLARAVLPRNDGRWDKIGSGRPARLDTRTQPDLFAAPKPFLPCMRSCRRNHERERRVLPRIEVSPANQVLILAPPALFLILRPGNYSGSAVSLHRQSGC